MNETGFSCSEEYHGPFRYPQAEVQQHEQNHSTEQKNGGVNNHSVGRYIFLDISRHFTDNPWCEHFYLHDELSRKAGSSRLKEEQVMTVMRQRQSR